MVEIQERDEGLLNFLTPSVLIIVGLLLLSTGALAILLVNSLIPILIPDATIAAVQMNLFGQIVGIIVTILFLIPFFGVKKIETESLSTWRIIKVLGVACFALTVATFLAFLLWVVFTTLGLPIIHSYGSLILTPEQLANPANIVLFFATTTIGAAVFEELIFRRMLIPTLETRGMAPTAAVLASSLGFALIHVPNDVINGSIGYVITHFITTFTLGLMLGLIYVFTRNILFPMIIHAFINFIAFSELILYNLSNFNLLLLFALILLAIWIIGILVGVLAVIWYFRTPQPRWAEILKMKSKINILPGLTGYLIIAFGLVSLQVVVELGIALIFFANIFALYAGLFLFYLVFFLLLLGLVYVTHYEPSTFAEEERSESHQIYDQASDVTLEPPPE